MEADAKRFTEALTLLSEADLRRWSANLEQAVSGGGWWIAERALEHVMRARCSRQDFHTAEAFGQHAGRIVVDTARNAGVQLPDRDVTRLARFARHIARSLVLGPLAQPYLQPVAGNWLRATGADRPPG